jgi:hypothetical protein
MLTQVCRDPSDPQYGCFDRDWWHYRIRDFPSIILQQGGYALWNISQTNACGLELDQRQTLRALASATCRFWNRRAQLLGAFEEYYPWEQGYPPCAFSTLAVMKLADDGAVKKEEVLPGASVAARQLLRRFEAQAANQQVAGLAALAFCKKNFPELVPTDAFEALVKRTLALQTSEGWFEEYGGPDLGYLSVTIDCLWDLYDATSDKRFLTSIESAMACIRRFLSATAAASIGMHNSRNTDYLVPYGLIRAALQPSEHQGDNVRLVERLFGDTSGASHFLNAIDDRYVCHYVGQSLFRAIRLLESIREDDEEYAESPDPMDASESHSVTLTQSGHCLRRNGGERALVTLRKGGIVTWSRGSEEASDFGWLARSGKRLYVSHWWSQDWKFRQDDDVLVVEGCLYEHRDIASTPWKHMPLRLASWLLGASLIGALKRRLIFAKPQSRIGFRRKLRWEDHTLTITDTFTNLPPEARLIPAPRGSKRHVASADSFHLEDLSLARNVGVTRWFKDIPGGREATTIIALSSTPPAIA